MKLTKPTDDQLNAAFAEKVCGAIEIEDGMMRLKNENVRGVEFESWRAIPDFTQSADVVLPYLERWPFRIEIGKGVGLQCGVVICGTGCFTAWGNSGWHRAIDPSVPRACVIALLRAHGVEVEL